MAGSHSDVWAQKVGLIFDYRPRVAVDNLSRWIERDEEAKLRRAIVSPGSHVCLYGPSGSGKTSLSKSIVARLQKKGAKFVYVRINHNSNWNSFKSQAIEGGAEEKATGPLSYKIGLRNLLPYVEIHGETPGDLGSVSRRQLIEALDIHNIGQFLIDADTSLLIDDVHFAPDELLEMLTSLAKEITDRSTSNSAKIVFVGADDIFPRILKLNDSLKDRTDEVALGSIRGDDGRPSTVRSDKVWKFIADGLVQLGLTDPRSDTHITREQLTECVQWVEHAANGLPKSIVMLGKRIAEKAEHRRRVSHADIISACKEMIQRNFRTYRAQFRELFHNLRADLLAQEVCLWMFRRGASKIHRIEELCEDLHDLGSYSMIEEAVRYLSQLGFVVVSGVEHSVFFAKDPLLAHTIGVAMTNSAVLGLNQDFFERDRNASQLLLRFVGDGDPE